MTELKSWTGRILRVDLSVGEVTTMDTSQYVPHYVGGMGVAARIAWEELEPGVGEFDPENMLFLMVGPLTGTLASGGGRVLVAGISPQMRPSVFSRSGMGGHWGAELKFAGFDGVVVVGKAESPVYLWVHDGECEIRDASEMWGTGTYATTARLRAEHGKDTRVASIGQAGENLVRFACIQTETGNAAGQGGFGAVMGSKNLKAIAVRGTLGVQVADPQRLIDTMLHSSMEGASPPMQQNWGRRRLNDPEHLNRAKKCGFCMTPCVNTLYMNVPGETNTGSYTAARHCWGYSADTMNAHIEARAMTADYGLNGWEISYGMIPWLQMCKQHGLLDDLDGIDIRVPDHPIENLRDAANYTGEFLVRLIQMVTFREGAMGNALAEGTCRAGHFLFEGKGAELLTPIYPRHWGETNHWNGHWGTGGAPYFPFWLVPILQFCFDHRDPASDSTHQYTEHVLRYIPEHGPNRGPLTWEEARYVCEQVYGTADACEPRFGYDNPDTKCKPAIFHHNRGMLVESLVLCDREHTRVFSMLSDTKQADTALMAKLYSACTGIETTEKELDLAGERVFNMIRAIGIRNHGRSRVQDWETAIDEAYPAFPDGVVLDLEQFAPMVDRYYALRGWNPENGWPTRERLTALGLEDVADELESLGKLG